jgi:hypothetical protein
VKFVKEHKDIIIGGALTIVGIGAGVLLCKEIKRCGKINKESLKFLTDVNTAIGSGKEYLYFDTDTIKGVYGSEGWSEVLDDGRKFDVTGGVLFGNFSET